MPAIKKRITAEYLEREQQRSEQNGRNTGDGDEEDVPPPAPPVEEVTGSSPLKRKAPGGTHLLKGLDGEVLVEKRKRILPPAELRLDAWLDDNLEKKTESTVSIMKLYQFYTDMCQQDSTMMVEIDVFRIMLRNKFGKEFGLKEDSAYAGLLKESKPRKKTVMAPSLGYKLKDLIAEAIKASGNPSKGVKFFGIKKFISAKYPALQIELKPQSLRSALDREVASGKVELVKGIGYCGFFRLPGPPDVEEEPSKSKKKGVKKAKEEESADSADDSAEKNGEESDKSQEKSEESSAEPADDKKKKDEEESMDETGDVKEEGKENEKDEKKAKKDDKKPKRKKPAKPKRRNGPRPGQGPSINDIFPLAMTYMAEPKEASFGRIRKYLEKHYGKVDIDSKLKRCMEHGCETGMWDRVSGSGASGSFQLQVDSFNPEHTESMTDMVCSAIIACTEPKISSVRLLKSYISEYHPEFNIDTRPIKLRNALERAEKQNQLRRISGIGMSGSFQLVEQFIPSPSVLAGDEDEEEYEEPIFKGKDAKEEVYVIRKTKSGRRAPIEKAQFDFSSNYKKRSGSSSGGRSSGKSKTADKKSMYAEESEEEESSSEEEEEEVEKGGYRPRPSKSRGGSAVSAKREPAKAAPARAKAQPAKGRTKSRAPAKEQTSPSPAKRGKPSPAKAPKRPPPKASKKPPPKDSESEEEEEEEETAPILPSPRVSKKNTPAKKTPAKSTPAKNTPSKNTPARSTPARSAPAKDESTPARRTPARKGRPSYFEEPEEEENSEVEEEAPSPPKKGRGGKAIGSKAKTTPSIPKRDARKEKAPEIRTSRSGKYEEPEEEEEEHQVNSEEEEETPTPPKKGRGGKAAANKAKATTPSVPKRDARKEKAQSTLEGRIPRTGKYEEPEEEEEDDEENYYEVEEETPAKKAGGGKAAGSKVKPAPSTPKREARKEKAQPTPEGGRTPRSASKSARKSLKEADSDEETDEEEYTARPTLSRGGKKR